MKSIILAFFVMLVLAGCQQEFESKVESGEIAVASESTTQTATLEVAPATEISQPASSAPAFLGIPELPK